VIQTWQVNDLKLDADAVLRGQGADPLAIRKRRPMLVEAAQAAIDEGYSLLQPKAIYCKLAVENLRHEVIHLKGGHTLKGKLIAAHLAPADYVIVMLFTIGNALEAHAAQLSSSDMVLGLALDGLGSAAVETLANAACRYFEDQAVAEGLQASIPLSPGMIGWSVDEGQPQIFKILQDVDLGVTLTSHGVMMPRKSLSMVQGFGKDMQLAGRTCDFCAMRETCHYQDHYESGHGKKP
jgi:hypothetical protein